ncbi:MAG: metallophosphoesterase family protein [Mycobacterium leprae]
MINRRQFLIGGSLVLLAATGCNKLKPLADKLKPLAEALPFGPEPPAIQEEGPRPQLRVVLLSDPHTEASAGGNGKLSHAAAEYRALKPDLWLVNGDLANNGKVEELEAFKQVMARYAKPEQMLVTTGNHDFYDQAATDAEELSRFLKAFGQKTPYSNRVAGGVHFVLLADEQWKTAPGYKEWAWLSAAQLRWFEQVLAANRDKFTVVCLHQPLQETVTWSWGGNDFAGCGQSKELQAILQKNPQVKLWFSGHTHMGAEVKGNVNRKGGVTYVGLGSTYYQFVETKEQTEFGNFRKDLSASQSRLLEVWPDRVVIRARDHVAHAWMPDYELTVKRG